MALNYTPGNFMLLQKYSRVYLHNRAGCRTLARARVFLGSASGEYGQPPLPARTRHSRSCSKPVTRGLPQLIQSPGRRAEQWFLRRPPSHLQLRTDFKIRLAPWPLCVDMLGDECHCRRRQVDEAASDVDGPGTVRLHCCMSHLQVDGHRFPARAFEAAPFDDCAGFQLVGNEVQLQAHASHTHVADLSFEDYGVSGLGHAVQRRPRIRRARVYPPAADLNGVREIEAA